MLKNKTILSALLTTTLMGLTMPTLASDDRDDEGENRYRQSSQSYEHSKRKTERDKIQRNTQNRGQYISQNQASQIAQNAVGGGTVEDIELENKRRGAYFDVSIRDKQGREYDIKVDAKTGKILSKRVDN